jgi:putative proteasome-type protease
MTYAVGLLVEEGLAMIADTRTNAGMDNFSVYRKLHTAEPTAGGLMVIATAGNLSVTQTALQLAAQGLRDPDTGETMRLVDAPNMFRAARLLGEAVRLVRKDLAPSMEAQNVNFDVTLLLGGRVGEGRLALYLIYSAGNFIECGPDSPFLQIGERKYGKPILDRAVKRQTALWDAVKIGLISFDSTMRSNLAVGLPLDLVVIPNDGEPIRRRIEVDDPYFHELGKQWSAALKAAHMAIPPPPYAEMS